MNRLLLCRAALVLGVVVLAAEAGAQSPTCLTPRPGPAWVCVDGGWLPPGHPGIPTTTPTPAPAPQPVAVPTPENTFWLNHRYVRGTTDVQIIGTGQYAGYPVVFAYCNAEGDGCFFKGLVRMFPSNASAVDWTNLGPY